MRIDLPGIEAFLGVANWGSFRRAAGHLNLSQAALSHRIKKLEESLGTPLLARTTRRVSLTRAGEELLPTAQRLVQDRAATLDALRGRRDAGTERLAIGCLPTVAVLHLPGVLAAFARRRPEVQVQVYDVSAAEIADRVRAGDAEFGVTILSAKSWDLEIAPVVSDPFVVVCPADHRFAAMAAVPWAELAAEPLIRISAEAWNRQLIDQALGPRRESLRWRIEVQHVATAVAMVREGLGLGVLPRSGLHASLGPDLAGVPLARPALSRTLGFVTRREPPPSAHAALLMSLVAARLKAGRHTGL
jgi:DNA-binding transcriptional LysR family regulator